ncbi:MAG: DnaD domain protein [Clostridia bacterium]|nr:DnaD domain protein [Clostridia bacterium]
MNYNKEKIDNIFLYDTKVDNIFISEYMALAPENYAKVYLLGLMYAENGQSVENRILSNQLNTEESMVEKAWKYWQEKGVVKMSEDSIKFLNLRERMFGVSKEEEEDLSIDDGTKEVLKYLEEKWGVLFSGKDLEEVASWTDFYSVEPGLIIKAIDYCKNLGKENVRYLERVIQGWRESGLKSEEDAIKYLEENDQRYYRYRRVFQALGFNRNATEAEREMIDVWFDEMKFTMERVIEACGETCGIGNPNIKYVNAVLTSWQSKAQEKGVDVNKKSVVTQAVLNNYYSYLREEAEKKAKERKEEVYRKIPKIKQLDAQMASLYGRITTSMISGNLKDQEEIRSKVDKLEKERAIILTENNFDMDYTDTQYSCPICKDTGLTDEGEKCQCVKQRIEEAEVWQRKIK